MASYSRCLKNKNMMIAGVFSSLCVLKLEKKNTRLLQRFSFLTRNVYTMFKMTNNICV